MNMEGVSITIPDIKSEKNFKKNIESIIINYNKSKNKKIYIYLKFVQSNSNK